MCIMKANIRWEYNIIFIHTHKSNNSMIFKSLSSRYKLMNLTLRIGIA
jgi:hypothetical protein